MISPFFGLRWVKMCKELTFNFVQMANTILPLVALSNGEADFLAHLAANRIVPVEEVGTFKPHPFTELTEALL